MKLLLVCYLLSTVLSAIIGIDFGQQYAKAIVLAPNINFEIVLTQTGKRKDLSSIAMRPLGDDIERVYGSDAIGVCSRFPQSCLNDVKSLLGRTTKDVESFYDSHFGIDLLEDDRNGIKLTLGLTNYEFSAEEIMAMNLLQIRERALGFLEGHGALPLLDDVAITVSPFATQETKQAYLDSLKLANFTNVLGLVDEGTAVALNFIMNRNLVDDETDVKQYHLVYDMGAGTTTATLFSFTPKQENSILEIESIGYDSGLGGKTLTNSIYQVLTKQFAEKFTPELSNKIKSKLYETAEKAKIILSANSEYRTTLESLYNDEDFKISVTRDEFEKLNQQVVQDLQKPLVSALNHVGISIDDVKSVILNGGSTRVPFIQNTLKTLIGNKDKISKSVNTDESCALGTTYRALQLKSAFMQPSDIKVIEKSNFDYSLRIDGETIPVFDIGSVANNSTDVTLAVLDKSTDTVVVELLENERAYKSYEITDLVKKSDKLTCKSKESKKVVGTFELDVNKMFDLSKLHIQCFSDDVEDVEEEIVETGNSTNGTTSKASKKSNSIYVPLPKATHLTIKPIIRSVHDKLKRKLAKLSDKDQQRVELNNLRNSLEGLCYEVRNYIEDNLDQLLEFTTQDDLDELVQEVRDLIEWLEFDSDDAKYAEIDGKFKQLSEKKSELTSYQEMQGKDLSITGMKKFHVDGNTMYDKVLERVHEFENEIADFEPKFVSEDFEFSKELERVETYLKNKNDGVDYLSKVKDIITTFKSNVADSEKFVKSNEKKWDSLMKKDIYHHYKKMSDGIVEMLTELISMELGHKEKVEMLDNKLKQLVKRKTQKEARLKQKQKKTEEPADPVDPVSEKADPVEDPTAEPIEDPVVEESSEIESESVQDAEPASTPEVEHDEL